MGSNPSSPQNTADSLLRAGVIRDLTTFGHITKAPEEGRVIIDGEGQAFLERRIQGNFFDKVIFRRRWKTYRPIMSALLEQQVAEGSAIP